MVLTYDLKCEIFLNDKLITLRTPKPPQIQTLAILVRFGLNLVGKSK